MPRTSQARQASRESSMVQQPRLPVRRVPGIRDSARWTPTTSCPASTARAAATAESTPPLMAARTRMCAFCGLVAGLPAGGPEEVHEQRVGRELALLAPLLYRRPESALNRQLAAEPRRAAVPAVWIEDSWPAIPAWRARAYAWGRAARSTSTSASVDGWPSVNRCAPREV